MVSFKLGLTLLLSPLLSATLSSGTYYNEIKVQDDAVLNDYEHALPHTYLEASSLPDNFSWGNVDGKSYLTHSLNQHLPQYCGSCWAHGALSAFADRIKIARGGDGDDINLSIQYVLNCGTEMAGSCHGGYHTAVYEFVKKTGYIPYDTCMPYIACSDESTDGFCPHVDTTCSATTTCRTCDTFAGMGGSCTEIDHFPNATVAEYGMVSFMEHTLLGDLIHAIKSEIFVRGPVATGINAEPIVPYKGGIFRDTSNGKGVNHIVSIVGWGTEKETGVEYWIIRNSWGQYWGELGYMRLELGQNLLGIEQEVAWVTPGSYTTHNFPCAENGDGCHDKKPGVSVEHYQDPSIKQKNGEIFLSLQQKFLKTTGGSVRAAASA